MVRGVRQELWHAHSPIEVLAAWRPRVAGRSTCARDAVDAQPAVERVADAGAEALFGSATSGPLFGYDNTPNTPYEFNHISSQDLKLGVRWSLEPPPVYTPPLVTKG